MNGKGRKEEKGRRGRKCIAWCALLAIYSKIAMPKMSYVTGSVASHNPSILGV